jgi:adenylate cyclase class 2
MYEVEVKVRADHGRVGEALTAAGAECVGTVTQVDTYYDHPVRDFAETDEALRLRRETDGEEESVVTYKGPLVEAASKTRREVETGVESGDDLDTVLEAVGFEHAAVVEKERTRYELSGYTVSLDSVAGLGEFVEVETEAETVEPAREGAFEVLERLGLDPDEQIRTSYLGLLLADGDAEDAGAGTDAE